MPLSTRKLLLLSSIMTVACAFGEDVPITVFTLKDGTQVEVVSYASANQEGEGIYAVTTTTGDRKVLAASDVARKEVVQRSLDQLPAFAKQKLTTQKKAGEEWTARAAAEKAEEERKRKEALTRAAGMAGEGDALRVAAAEEQAVRRQCAMLWDAQQAALAKAKTSQEAITRARMDWQSASDDLRTLDRWTPDTPDELERWRSRRLRDERRMVSAENQIRDSTGDLAAATDEANRLAGELAKGKASLEQAQAKLVEAQRRYAEAKERFKTKPAQPSDPAREEIRPAESNGKETRTVPPTPAGDGTPAGSVPKSTVVRSIEKGEFIQLADASLWEIHPEDRVETARWQPEQEVTVVAGNDPKYSNRLINSATQSAVKAKKLK